MNTFSFVALRLYIQVSICLVFVNTGWQGDFIWRVLKSYVIAMPIAFICVLFVRPIVVKLVAWTVKSPQ